MTTIPVIRLEVERMQSAIVAAISEQTAAIDADIRRAVEETCTPENIARTIRIEVDRVLNLVIKEEVQRFYQLGEGRKVIRAAVEQRLTKDETYTPLDNNWKGRD